MVTKYDRRNRVRRVVLTSGDNTFFTLGGPRHGQVTHLHVDSAFASGAFGLITLRLDDVFAPTGGSSGVVSRWQTAVQAGNVEDIPLNADVQVLGRLVVNTNLSGPIVTLGINLT